MRVLIILKYIPSALHHQKSDLLRTTIEAHQAGGLEVVLLTTGQSAGHEWEEIKIPYLLAHKAWQKLRQKWLKQYFGSSLNASIVKQVARYHATKPIDLIFAECTNYSPALQAQRISRALNRPYVVREHKIYERTIKSTADLKEGYLQALREADALVTVSPLLGKIMQGIGVRDQIGHLPNALSDDFFSPPAGDNAYRQWAGNAFLWAGWTRWRPFKRADLLLEAFSRLIERGLDLKLILAGPLEPEENRRGAEAFIKARGLTDKVWLTGEVARPAIHELAYACDGCVIPSDYETFGLPALEAMAAGKPVVTTRCNGPEYVVENKNQGRTVERGSAAALAEGMLAVYENYEHFNAAAISRRAAERFSKTAVAGHFSALYESLLGDRPGKQRAIQKEEGRK